jgi:hypothetical protein
VIEYHNRLLAVAPTRGGKSELLNVLASALQNQWALVDPKEEFAIDGVPKVHNVQELDFANQRILHWVPPPTPEAWEHFFARVLALRKADPPGRFTAVVHEAGYSCQFRPNAVGPNHNTFLSQGEAHGLGAWYATQRPKLLPTFATSEPAHVFAFAEKMTRGDDHATLAESMSMPPQQLADAQQHLLAVHGRYAYVWFDRRAGAVQGMAPLPDELRARNIVRRTTPE